VATFDRLRRGLPPANPRSATSIAELLLTAWNDGPPAAADLALLDRTLLLVADHELNAATFAARVAASTRADLGSAVLAAAATYGGPLHGGAARFAGELLTAVAPEQATADVERRFDSGERIPGFGHSVYRRGDPRVPFFRQLAEERARATGDRHHLAIADHIAAIVAKRTGLLPNMDLYAAVCWLSLGVPADLLPAIFAVGRMAGWIAHVLEQSADNRLIRPRARYVGPVDQHYVPIEERP
jgi:citrate synthase